jgi:hypothetical protein
MERVSVTHARVVQSVQSNGENEMSEVIMQTSTTNNVSAIKKFFELDGGRKISMDELKAMSIEERHEIGQMAGRELEKRGIKF